MFMAVHGGSRELGTSVLLGWLSTLGKCILWSTEQQPEATNNCTGKDEKQCRVGKRGDRERDLYPELTAK